MSSRCCALGGVALAFVVVASSPLHAQDLPLEPPRTSGLPVSPVFEGWYPNPDGTYSLSFGYINRNTEEVVEIPVGPQNSIDGGEPEPGLPTRFLPRRHYGVFTVTVPDDFGSDEAVVWTIDIRSQTFSIPGRLHPLYQIDALGAPATGFMPPTVSLAAAGNEVSGPHGMVTESLQATVGEPLPVTLHVADVGAPAEDGDEEHEVTVRPYKWSGPGEVEFSGREVVANGETHDATLQATFSQPGDYVIYLRANNEPLASSGQEQCCWTNVYVNVTVTP